MKNLFTLFTALTFAGSFYSQLLLHYDFENNLNDLSGNGFTATQAGGSPVYGSGSQPGTTALRFDRTAASVLSFPASATLQPANFPMSVVVTFRITDMANSHPANVIFATDMTMDTYKGVNLAVHPNGSINLNLGSGGATSGSGRRTLTTQAGLINDNTWYTVTAIVRSDSDMEIWVNCQQYLGANDYNCGSILDNTQPFYNGCATIPAPVYSVGSQGGIGMGDATGSTYTPNNTYYMNGEIDELRYFGHALTSAEVLNYAGDMHLSVTNNDPTLVLANTGDSYQWIDCSTMSNMNGANSQSFTASQNGSYAVVMQLNGCTDTSSCFAINSVAGLDDINALSEINVFPNPGSGNYHLNTSLLNKDVMITLHDIQGKIVYAMPYHTDVSGEIDFDIQLEAGTYVMSVSDLKQIISRQRIIHF